MNNKDDAGIGVASPRPCTVSEQDTVINDFRSLVARTKVLSLSLFEQIAASVGGNLVRDSEERRQWQ